MQMSELAKGIASKFEQSRIVFWFDPEKSFTEELEHLAQTLTEDITFELLKDLVVINMAHESVLALKKRIEIDEPNSKFLLYFPSTEPEPNQDWLLDIRLYSEQFFADHSSMLLNELGIPKMALRSHILKRQVFFANKQRLAGLKKWVTENEDELTLDRKMIAVVVKAESAELSDILFALLREYSNSLQEGNSSLPLFEQLSKFGLDQSLWFFLKEQFGYTTDRPSLANFVLKLFCTDFYNQIEGKECDWLSNNVLNSASGQATSLAFMASWRDSRTFSNNYEMISMTLSKQLEIDTQSKHYRPIHLVECTTFEIIEQIIIRGLVKELLDTSRLIDRVQFKAILSKRSTSYWAESRKEYFAIYKALFYAEELINLRSKYVDGFHFNSAKTMYDAYTSNLYQFDQSYRLFNEYAHSVLSKGSDILRQLDNEIENIYTNWYLSELSLSWDLLLNNENLLEKWQIIGVPQQYNFYKEIVRARLDNKSTKRVFVIISDALRYEIAHELSMVIDNEKRFKTTLKTQLGVLPSYTQLGMAALLPHQTLDYKSEQGNAVYVDGVSSQGIDNRNTILSKVNGIVVSAKELMSWSNQEGRDKVKNAEIVYIYHDTIDAIGDKLSTEDRTFEACRTAIEELKDLVARVINRLNASQVVITADHGFIFQQSSLVSANKTSLLNSKPTGAMEAKKRYIIGTDLPDDESCWKAKIKNTAPAVSDTEFLLPKAMQRFHFIGGAKFVHGGAMLQEICVPILVVQELDKKQAAKHEKQPVSVVLATQPIKLVNNIDKIKLLQTDPASGSFISRILDLYIIDAEGNVVSSRETVNFDSESTIMDERTQEITLKLIGADFNRNAKYTLILENTELGTCYSQYAVTIDLAFQDDFF